MSIDLRNRNARCRVQVGRAPGECSWYVRDFWETPVDDGMCTNKSTHVIRDVHHYEPVELCSEHLADLQRLDPRIIATVNELDPK